MTWLYENDCKNAVRYVLGETGKNPLVCFGINPSTAEPDNLDRTLAGVKSISQKKGYDGWIMFNVYPQRSTDPNGMHKKMNKTLHDKNVAAIARILDAHPVRDLWVAWGGIIEKRTYLLECVADIYRIARNKKFRWLSMGKLTKAGHPHHPLYLPHAAQMAVFDMDAYLERIDTPNRSEGE